jgi:hypothetical protein
MGLSEMRRLYRRLATFPAPNTLVEAIWVPITKSGRMLTLGVFLLVDRPPDWCLRGLRTVLPDMKSMSGGPARSDEEAADR